MPRPHGVLPGHVLVMVLLTPPLAALLLLALSGARPLGVGLVLASLAPAYALGAAPVCLAGLLDLGLARSRRPAALRLGVAAGIALGFGLLVLAPLSLTGRVQGALPLLAPLALALSAGATLALVMLAARVLR